MCRMRFVTNPIGPVIARPTDPFSILGSAGAGPIQAGPTRARARGREGRFLFREEVRPFPLRIVLCRAWRTTCTATCMALLEKQTPRCSLVVTQTAREYFECD